jgi:dihydrofolate synthase/folylpolyglutamate synthase
VDIDERLREVERDIASRRPEHQISPTLDRIGMLTGLLGDPQRAYPVIHVTGTNGKTSMTRMIDALLRERGLRTGRFTSPHLVSMRERICIDGQPLPAERFVELYEEISPYVGLVDDSQPAALSFFEVLVGMAFAAFADAPVDVAVIEVGVGGMWDATNVADGAVAVVGPVSLDHMNYLGDTIEEIAMEKAGIIKEGAVAVLAQQQLAAAEVLMRRAAEVNAQVAREGIEFGVTDRELAVGGQRISLRGLRGSYEDIYLPLFGAHQAGNAACALAAAEAFAGVADFVVAAPGGENVGTGGDAGSGVVIDPEPILANTGQDRGAPLDAALVRDAFAKASSPGRLEVLRSSPTVIADAGHNPSGMAASVQALTEAYPYMRLTVVFAVSEDKDVSGVLAELEPVADNIVVTRNSSPRSAEVDTLAAIATEVFGADRVRAAERLDDAIDEAVSLADEAADADLPGRSGVLITGSVITAGDARALLTPGRGVADPPAGAPARHAFTAGDLS